MAERNASPPVAESALPDIRTMRAAAAAVLAPDALPMHGVHGAFEEERLTLRRHIKQLIPEVEVRARTRPVESVPRDVALAEVGSARVLLKSAPEPGLWGTTQHLKYLARELRALCDQYDMLTGVRPLGVRS